MPLYPGSLIWLGHRPGRPPGVMTSREPAPVSSFLSGQGAPASASGTARPTAPKRSFASRWFGYDIFLSFALGPPPRGTHSYASDLARRLRERDFSVFFSEDETPPGEQLDSALRTALRSSKTLVVIANRGTLKDPRFVRTEVEEFREYHPDRPVIPINVGGALQDPALIESAQKWLGYEGKIWLDESEEAVAAGMASEGVAERLSMAPARAKSNVKWRRVVRGVIATLAVLAAVAIGAAGYAWFEKSVAEKQARIALARQLAAQSQSTLENFPQRSLLLAVEALATTRRAGEPTIPTIEECLLQALSNVGGRSLNSYEGARDAVAISADGHWLVTGNVDGTAHLWDLTAKAPATAPISLGGHEGPVTVVAISPDSHWLFTGAIDQTDRLWDLTAKDASRAFRTIRRRGLADAAAFSSDNH